jgi:hypothetical protein
MSNGGLPGATNFSGVRTALVLVREAIEKVPRLLTNTGSCTAIQAVLASGKVKLPVPL